MKIKSNLINPKPKGQHQKRVKKAICSMLFPAYTTTITIAKGRWAWNDKGNIQIILNNKLIRCI